MAAKTGSVSVDSTLDRNVTPVESDPLVSVDYIGNLYSSTIDLPSTMVMGPNLAKVFSWYDNEMGYSARCVDLLRYVGERL